MGTEGQAAVKVDPKQANNVLQGSDEALDQGIVRVGSEEYGLAGLLRQHHLRINCPSGYGVSDGSKASCQIGHLRADFHIVRSSANMPALTRWAWRSGVMVRTRDSV